MNPKAALILCLLIASSATAEQRIIGYYAGWSRHYGVADIPADKLTHVNYAFAVIKEGEISARGADEKFRQLKELKEKHPHLRTLISVGGWGGSAGFSDVALTPQSRRKFARSCAAFASKHGFDGVDIDWEYPASRGHANATTRPQDTQNFTSLLADLREHLDEQGIADGKQYLLTIAAPAGGQHKKIELARIHPLLDFINIMTYDFAGPWDKRTGFNAPLYGNLSSDSAVKAYLAAGVPAEKIVLGVPFYGRAWGGVKDVDNGLGRPHDGKSPPAIGSGAEWAYRSIAEHYVDKGPTRFWHEQAKVPWLFDASKGLMVSYDDPESLRLKANYAREKKLGGVMIWELSQDDAKHSLLNALHEGLTSSASTPRADR